MKNVILVLVVLIAGAAIYFGISSQRKANQYRTIAIKAYIEVKIEAREKIRNYESKLDSLGIAKQATADLFLEYLEVVEQGEENLTLINEHYEEQLNQINGLDTDELRQFILDRIRPIE